MTQLFVPIALVAALLACSSETRSRTSPDDRTKKKAADAETDESSGTGDDKDKVEDEKTVKDGEGGEADGTVPPPEPRAALITALTGRWETPCEKGTNVWHKWTFAYAAGDYSSATRTYSDDGCATLQHDVIETGKLAVDDEADLAGAWNATLTLTAYKGKLASLAGAGSVTFCDVTLQLNAEVDLIGKCPGDFLSKAGNEARDVVKIDTQEDGATMQFGKRGPDGKAVPDALAALVYTKLP